MTDIEKYLSFVLTMFVAFGITFEVPVIVVVLVRMRVVSLDKLRAIRPYVIVGAFIVGAIFTPPDVISQLMLALPLWLLYELGLQLARFVSVPDAEGPRRSGRQVGPAPHVPYCSGFGRLHAVNRRRRASVPTNRTLAWNQRQFGDAAPATRYVCVGLPMRRRRRVRDSRVLRGRCAAYLISTPSVGTTSS
jgi:hypothetical protein